jgi:uncharacterized membrane protein
MTGDEKYAGLLMNAMMFMSGLFLMAVVAVAGALFGEPTGVGVDDAIVVTARVERELRSDAASAAAARPGEDGAVRVDGVAKAGGS